MLDRLRRGLTAPRFDDNTDKLKKQIRRWPDPFGLLRDREPTDVIDPLTVPSSTTDEPGSDVTAMAEPGVRQTSVPDPASPLDKVISDLEQELSNWPKSLTGKPERMADWRRRQTDLRMLYLLAGRSAESIRVIEALPPEEQEFWQSLMLAVNNYRDASENEEAHREHLNQTIDHVRDAVRHLQPLSTLEIRRMTFCDRIDGFGSVTEFPAADFNPGQRLLIYAEVRNFRSDLTTDGYYRSKFKPTLEFRREDHDEVFETIELPEIRDLCSAERTDYYQSFEVTVPALAGKYLVRLQLRDQLSLQTAESQLEFHVR